MSSQLRDFFHSNKRNLKQHVFPVRFEFFGIAYKRKLFFVGHMIDNRVQLVMTLLDSLFVKQFKRYEFETLTHSCVDRFQNCVKFLRRYQDLSRNFSVSHADRIIFQTFLCIMQEQGNIKKKLILSHEITSQDLSELLEAYCCA